LSNTNNTFTGTFNGNGLGLTALNSAALQGPIAASNLTSVPAASLTGTIQDARLSANVPLLNTPNTAMQATAQLDVSAGTIGGANLINGGSGYYSPPNFFINDPGGMGFGASGYLVMSGGSVSDIFVSGGELYSPSTTITIAPPPSSYPVFTGSVGWGYGPSELTADQTGAIELGDSTAYGTTPYIDFHYGSGAAVQQYYSVRLINDAEGQLSVLSGVSSPPTVMVMKRGAVGVGTTNPLTALHAKSFSGQCEISIESGDSGGHRWTLQSTGVQSLPASFQIIDRTVGVARLLINTNGQVGIGTTSPDATLSVNGSADKPGGGSWSTYSDARLKCVGASFTHGLDALSAIQPIHYHYRPDNPLNLPSQPDYVGVVAQQVQQTVPEAVHRSENGYLVVNNDPILWTMLNAIKELKAENDSLKHRVERLENESASR
ncbi:MAG TPA: tail fiber domain-containing protein, partial [Verrucomicrobiae bacterium]|nr:tail fiber domain-containing protein [Verrucomicrobiae bacterium]